MTLAKMFLQFGESKETSFEDVQREKAGEIFDAICEYRGMTPEQLNQKTPDQLSKLVCEVSPMTRCDDVPSGPGDSLSHQQIMVNCRNVWFREHQESQPQWE